MKKVAIFDIDGTLYDSHLGVEFLREMSGINAIKGVSQSIFNAQYKEWLKSSEKTAYYDKHFDTYYDKHLYGVGRELFNKAAQKVAKNAFLHIYTETLSALKKHQEDGRFIILLSKSPEPAIAKIAEMLGADEYWGWQFNFDNSDKYVDQYTYPYDESNKAYIIKQLLAKHSLSLEDSYAYGDSNGDMSMLELVAHPTAVNPEKDLLSRAQKSGWTILYTSQIKE